MKKTWIFACIAAFVAISTNAGMDQDYKGLVGEWKFEVPTAPYGYEKGMLYFFEKDNKLEGEVNFGDNYKIKLANLRYAGDSLKCNLYVDNEYVDVKAIVEGEKIRGVANTSIGEMNFTAEKTGK
jgi:hypothetical protein